MKRTPALSLLFATLLCVDQVTKLAISKLCPLNVPSPIIGQFVMIRYVRNQGAVFGLFSAYPNAVFWLKCAATVIFLCGMLYLMIDGQRFPFMSLRGVRLSLTLIASGAAGNFIDRLHTGAVIDFIDMGIGSFRWYTYNLADAYLLIGVVLFLICSRQESRKDGAVRNEETMHAQTEDNS